MTDDIKIEQENNEDSGGNEPEGKIKKLKEKLKKCQKEKEEYLAGWQRAKADFINARKEEEKAREEFIKFSNQNFLLDILPVLDSFNLAFESNPKQDKGFLLIKTQLQDVLRKYGLEAIKTLGEKFNPEFHESLEEIESGKENGIIIEEVQRGYTLHNKVIRASKVKISRQRRTSKINHE